MIEQKKKNPTTISYQYGQGSVDFFTPHILPRMFISGQWSTRCQTAPIYRRVLFRTACYVTESPPRNYVACTRGHWWGYKMLKGVGNTRRGMKYRRVECEVYGKQTAPILLFNNKWSVWNTNSRRCITKL